MLTTARRLALTLLVTTGTALGTVALAQPALALPGQTTAQSSLSNTSAVKFVTASCPANTVATGGSAVIGGTSEARVDTAVPSAAGYTVVATAPRGGINATWSLVVTAVCIAPPPGLEYRTAFTAADSAAAHTATATCTQGKQVIGMGGSINPERNTGFEEFVLTAVRSNAPNSSVSAAGHEDRVGTSRVWNTGAVAVCANPVPGLSYPSASTALDSTDPKSATAACPAGTTALAGGFDVSKGEGLTQVGTFFIDPDLPQDRTRQGFGVTGHEDRAGFTGDWRVLSQVVCAA